MDGLGVWTPSVRCEKMAGEIPMTAYRKSDSGLVVPVTPPKKPSRQFGPLEIRDDDRRELAVEALSKLWDAMDLSGKCSFLQGDGVQSLRYQQYRLVGEALLGVDCPEKEILT